MKICFLLDDSLDKPDGVQQYVLTLGQWLTTEGHKVHYIVGETHRQDVQHVHSLSKNFQLTFNGNTVSIPLHVNNTTVRELLHREQFDVLHVQMPYSPMLAGKVITAAPAGTAIVGTFHIVPFSWLESGATRLLKLLIRRSLKRIDVCVSVSPPAAKFARKSLGIKSLVVPNVINVSAFSRGKRLHKLGGGKINIVFLGRLVERKGCIYLLKAIEQLHRKRRLGNVRVIICGKGPLEADLKYYAHKHHLGAIVRFAGFVNEAEKANYLASADIAVFPSIGGESFGIVLAEAMAAGADVLLAGNNSGYRSIMPTKSDQLINPTDTDAFAKILQHFVTNSAARQRAKRWQQEHVMQYDVRVAGHKLVEIYDQTIAKKLRQSDNTTHESN